MSSEKEIVRFHCRQVPSPFILRSLFANRVLVHLHNSDPQASALTQPSFLATPLLSSLPKNAIPLLRTGCARDCRPLARGSHHVVT